MHILWLKTELLHPLDKGGRIRTYQMLRELHANHRITYLTLDDGAGGEEAVTRASEYCRDLIRVPFNPPGKSEGRFWADLLRNLVSPLPYAIAKYRSDAMRSRIRDVVARDAVDLIVCDFLFPFINVPDGLPVPVVLFEHNVEAVIWARHAEVARGVLRRAYFREQWRRMRAFEQQACRFADHVVAVSAEDRLAIGRDYGVDTVSEVATGVDLSYFRPAMGTVRRENELVFTGSMDWLPNEDGVTWFCERILPRIRQRAPGTMLTIVGRTPSERVRSLADHHAGVTVTGSVPDVRPYIERAAVFVVPLRIGGGTRLKIFEAMAMEVPVVSTTVGAEGLPVRPEEELLLADGEEAFAAAVLQVLEDRTSAVARAARAAERVRREFGWRQVALDFAAVCARVVDRPTLVSLPVGASGAAASPAGAGGRPAHSSGG